MITCVIDIDRTIADNAARAQVLAMSCSACGSCNTTDNYCVNCGSDLVKYTDESFDEFLSADSMALDKPILTAQHGMKFIRDNYNYIYITGRKDKQHREVTESWLAQHYEFRVGVDSKRLFMRTASYEGMKASDYKEAVFLKYKQDHMDDHYIFFEDDPYIWTMYSKHGIVIKCPEGWETFNPRGKNRLTEPERNR